MQSWYIYIYIYIYILYICTYILYILYIYTYILYILYIYTYINIDIDIGLYAADCTHWYLVWEIQSLIKFLKLNC